MNILKNFGVEPVLLLAQVVNFLIVFFLLKKFAYKPILAMLAKRKKMVADSVEHAAKTEELLKKTEEREKEALKQAHAQAQEILSDAQKQASDLLAQAEEGAKTRVAHLLEDGQKEIASQVEDAQRQLSKQTAELAVKLLEKSLSNLVDSKTQKEVIARATKKLS